MNLSSFNEYDAEEHSFRKRLSNAIEASQPHKGESENSRELNDRKLLMLPLLGGARGGIALGEQEKGGTAGVCLLNTPPNLP